MKKYKSDKPDKKYYIITNDNKKVYFGQASSLDFTLHKNEASKEQAKVSKRVENT